MKTEFELEFGKIDSSTGYIGEARIVGSVPDNKPYVAFDIDTPNSSTCCWIKDKDLERFAVNILKALKSKKLTP